MRLTTKLKESRQNIWGNEIVSEEKLVFSIQFANRTTLSHASLRIPPASAREKHAPKHAGKQASPFKIFCLSLLDCLDVFAVLITLR